LEPDPFALAGRAAAVLAERTGIDRHDALVVLGSGWAGAADRIGTGVEVPTSELPGFPEPTAPSHRGVLRSVSAAGRPVLVSLGRLHLYEGHTPSVVAHAVRVAAAAGCGAAILTNASGSLNADWGAGRPVLIADQINLTGVSPLTGAGRFIDLSDLYSPRLRGLVHELDPSIPEGVYLGVHGPEFETPAEIRGYRAWGVDLVGMSTVIEAIAARHAGMEVCGIALVTNLAAGMRPVGVDAAEVVSVGEASAPAVADLVARLLERV
jgi:purine-nucleoside phosphorylase